MPLGGQTLIARCARCIQGSKYKFPVLLTTDDEGIAKAGASVGWNTPFLRPDRLASDSASTFDTIVHALDNVERRDNGEIAEDPEITLVIQATSPFRTSEIIDKALDLLRADPGLDAAVGMRRSFVPAAFHFLAGDRLVPASDSNAPVVVPNGTVYAVRTAVLRREGTLFPQRLGGIVCDWIASLDIDTADDWRLAEMIAGSGVVGKAVDWTGTCVKWTGS